MKLKCFLTLLKNTQSTHKNYIRHCDKRSDVAISKGKWNDPITQNLWVQRSGEAPAGGLAMTLSRWVQRRFLQDNPALNLKALLEYMLMCTFQFGRAPSHRNDGSGLFGCVVGVLWVLLLFYKDKVFRDCHAYAQKYK